MRYYIGHWQWSDEAGGAYHPPAGAVSCLDFAPLPVQGTVASSRAGGFFVTEDDVLLPREYTLLGRGDSREIAWSTKAASACEAEWGFRPEGDTIADAVWDALTRGGDPSGDAFTKPLQPGTSGYLDVYLRGARIKNERFVWGQHPHTNKLQALLRADFDLALDDLAAGKFDDGDLPFKALDYLCAKYRVEDWREFVTPARQKDVPGRVKHETTLSDDFTRVDGATIGNLETWTKVLGNGSTPQTVSNQVFTPRNANSWRGRVGSDLSGVDQTGQVVITSIQAASTTGSLQQQAGPLLRYSSSADTCYRFFYDTQSNGRIILGKVITNVQTNFLTTSITEPATPFVVAGEANGSTLSQWVDGAFVDSTTDTAITGNLRTGAGGFCQTGSSTDCLIDDWTASDIAPPAANVSQLLLLGVG